MKRLTVTAITALGLLAAAPASAAPPTLVPVAFEGSGEQTIIYDYNNDEGGPILTFNQHFDWRLAGAGRPLRLPKRGGTSATLPIQVRVISAGGGTFGDFERGDVQYTCSADRSYRTRATLRVRAVRSGWRLTLQALKGLDPGPPACTDATAGQGFSWPTGGDWFVQRLRDGGRVGRTPARRLAVRIGSSETSHDCSDDPRISLRCVEAVRWSGRLQLRRR